MIFERIKEIIVDQLGVNDEDVKLETKLCRRFRCRFIRFIPSYYGN